MTTFTHPAGFLADPAAGTRVDELYDADRERLGYVANLTRVWGHSPDALGVLSAALRHALELGGLQPTESTLVVAAAASAIQDAYCSFAFGSKLAGTIGGEITGQVVRGTDDSLTERGRLLAGWARQVASDPNGTTAAQVEQLRDAGFDDRRIFGLTFFVALRVAFSTVNDALGAGPDDELVARAPAALADVVTFGRVPSPRDGGPS